VELYEVDMNKAFERFKALADIKKSIYDEDLIAIVTQETVRVPDRFELLELNVTSSSTSPPRASVRLRVDGEQRQADGDGDGMVDACYKVISQITGVQPKLERYAVKAITGGTDALGEVSCLIHLDGVTASGQGAHTDIIQASALAYVNALNKLEYRRRHYQQVRSGGP
jgi:2-isopropylmalate synthase